MEAAKRSIMIAVIEAPMFMSDFGQTASFRCLSMWDKIVEVYIERKRDRERIWRIDFKSRKEGGLTLF